MLNLPFTLNFATDSYKVSHWLQFPPDTKKLFYYIEPRIDNKIIIPFGFQQNIKDYLLNVPTLDEIEEANELWRAHGFDGIFNYEGWKKIAKMGYLPIEIKAVSEGLPIDSHNVIATIVNTNDEFYWLPGWIETLFLQIWYPTTVATIAFEIRQVIKNWMEKTSDSLDGLEFKLHDFGFRGASSYQTAMIGSMAHLLSFNGTDTIAGIQGILKYYNPNNDFKIDIFSIPATEHSTTTSWERKGEKDAYENMINTFGKPDSMFAMVMDSYDIDNAIDNIIGKELKQKIIDSGAMVIFRPDSQDPIEMPIRIIKKLANIFGYQKNKKGYNILNNVRVIQGDGISDKAVINNILAYLTQEGFSADNIAFGMGGGLLQKCDRDTLRFAMKCSARYDGMRWYDVFKQPKGCEWKASKKGLLELYYNNETGKYLTADKRHIPMQSWKPILRTIFKDGKLLINEDFNTIRNRIRS